MANSLQLTFDLEDTELLYVAGGACKQLDVKSADDRFSPKEDVLVESLLTSPAFEEGSVLWCETAADALLLQKIHLAAGLEAYFLYDDYADEGHAHHAVLTTWNIYEKDLDSALGELLLLSEEEEEDWEEFVDRGAKMLQEAGFQVATWAAGRGGGVIVLDESYRRQNEAQDLLSRKGFTVGRRSI